MTEPLRFHLQVAPNRTAIRPASPRAAVQTNPVVRTILAVAPGRRGATGPAGTGTQIVGEAPIGAKDGANTIYTTAHAFQSGSIAVYCNGLREHRGVGYTEASSTQITLSYAPVSADDITVDYLIP